MQWSSLLPIASAISLILIGCQEDPAIGGEETGTGESGPADSETTGDEIGDTDTDTDTGTDEGGNFVPETETETGELPPPPTCQEMLDCVFMCLDDLGLECVQACGEGYDPAEVEKAGALLLCLGQGCVEKEQCSLSDFTAEACVGCIGLGLFLPEPPGCEEQAAACE